MLGRGCERCDFISVVFVLTIQRLDIGLSNRSTSGLYMSQVIAMERCSRFTYSRLRF